MFCRQLAFLSSVICLLTVSSVAARDYYVSPEGDDTAVGSQSQPWQTLGRVNQATLQPGDRVMLAAEQTHPGPLTLDATDSGSESQPIVVTTYGDGRATIDAQTGDAIVIDRCNHVRITNLKLVGSGRNNGNNGSGVRATHSEGLEINHVEATGFRMCGVSVDGVHNVRITHVHAHNNGFAGIASGETAVSSDLYIAHSIAENNPGDPQNKHNHSGNGIVVGWGKDVLVEYCLARNNGWDMPREGNGPVGIWCWNTDRIVIQHCVSHSNRSPGDDGGGFDIDGGTTNGILQYNLSYDNDGPGYFLCQYPSAPPLTDNIIRYNISQNDGRKTNRKAGIDVFAANEQATGCQIYNNTVFNEHGAAVGFGGLPIHNVVFTNNIFVTKERAVVGDASHARFHGNVWWTFGESDPKFGDQRSFAEWVAATGHETIDGKQVGIFADPLLTAVASATCDEPADLEQLSAYQLLPGSPCRLAGRVVTAHGGHDFWGNPVPVGPAPSVGAHQPSAEQ